MSFIIFMIYSLKFFRRLDAQANVDELMGGRVLPTKQREKIDDFALSCFVGIAVNVRGLGILVLGIGSRLGLAWLGFVGVGVFIIVSLAYIYYIHEYVLNGWHFRKKE